MAKEIELRRHTDNDGDALTPDGVEAAVRIGRALTGGYAIVAASEARRAIQTAGCLLAGLGETIEPLGKGEGVVIAQTDDGYGVQSRLQA